MLFARAEKHNPLSQIVKHSLLHMCVMHRGKYSLSVCQKIQNRRERINKNFCLCCCEELFSSCKLGYLCGSE